MRSVRARSMAGVAAVLLLLASMTGANVPRALAAPPPIPDPVLTLSSPTIVEGDAGPTTMTFVAMLDRPAPSPVTFDWATADLGATVAGGDYVAGSGSATIAMGARSTTIDVTVNGDTDDEFDGEYLRLHVTNLAGAEGDYGYGLDADGRIVDDDKTVPPEPVLTVTPPTVIEGGPGDTTPMTFVAMLDRPAPAPVTFHWETVDDYYSSAKATDGDFVSDRGDVTIPSGIQSASVSITINGDSEDESESEYLYLRLTDITGTGDASAGVLDQYGTIIDDDPTPIPTPLLTVSYPNVTEGDAGDVDLTFDLTLDRPATDAVTVHYATEDWTTSSADDYDATSGTATIPAGQQATKVVVKVHGDTDATEVDEYLQLQLSSLSGATFGGGQVSSSTYGLIYDDDGPAPTTPIPTLTPLQGNVVEADAGTVVLHIPLVLDRAPTTDVTVHATATDYDTPRDFDDVDTTITIPEGQTLGFVDVTVHGDTIDEGVEQSVYVQLDGLTGDARFLTQTPTYSAYGTILDDDITIPDAPVLTPIRAAIVEGDSGAVTMHVPLVLDRPLDGALTIHATATDVDAAYDPRDFDDVNTVATIDAGALFTYIDVTVHGDTIDEDYGDYFYLTLDGLTGDATLADGADGRAYAEILDDDNTTVPAPRLTPGVGSVVEGNTGTVTLAIPLVLDRVLATDVTVHATATEYLANEATRDYDDLDTFVTIPAGSLVGYVPLTVHGDTFAEPATEYPPVSLEITAGPARFYPDHATTSAYGQIYDDDDPGPGVVRFLSSTFYADESDDTAEIWVTRDTGWTGPASVDVTITGGSAVVGEDFDATPTQTVEWEDFEAGPQLVEIPLLDDNIADGVKTITLALSVSDGVTATTEPITAELTIADDEAPTPPVADAGPDQSGDEGEDIALDGDVTNPPSNIHWSAAPGAGVDAGADCDFANPAAPTTTVSCTDDGTWTLTLTANDGINPPSSDTLTLTVANVAPTVDISAPADADEFATDQIVTLDAAIGDAGTNDTATCQIDWGDGTPEAGIVDAGDCTGSHAYDTDGTPQISVTATDDDGDTSTAATVDIVIKTSVVPIVEAGEDAGGNEGAPIALGGSVQNPPASIEWTAEPGPDVDAGADCVFDDVTDPTTDVTCTDDGTWTLTLTADDGVDPPVSDTMTLTVDNVAPTASILSPLDGDTAAPGAIVSLSATLADAGTNDTITCKIDWDDGTVEDGDVAGDQCTGSHAYTGDAAPTITVTATDDDGDASGDTVDIVIATPASTASIDDVSLDEGNAATTDFGFTVTLSHPSATPVVVDYTIDDGTATTADGDYIDGSGSVTFDPGDTTKSIVVKVKGDLRAETDETFSVGITSDDVAVTDDTGSGLIENDDVNDAPVLAPIGNQTVLAGATVLVPLSASDADGDTLAFTSANLPTFAELLDGGDGTALLTLQPQDADIGPHAGVEIIVSDPLTDDRETITITVAAPGNRKPYARDDTGSTHGTAPAVVPVLGNDTDIDGDDLTVIDFDDRGGRVDCGAGSCTYTPAAGFTGTDSFTYTVSDGRGGTAQATVEITVVGNEPPTAEDDFGSGRAGDQTGIDVLNNDDDSDGDRLSVVPGNQSGPSGSFSCSTTVCTFSAPAVSPTGTYPWTAHFTYVVSDGHGLTDSAAVSITVTENRPPTAHDDDVSLHGSGIVTFSVVANDTDPDADQLHVIEIEGLTGHGEVECDQICVFTPPAGPLDYPFHASFRYTIDDGHPGAESSADVNITIFANNSPIARKDGMTAPGVDVGYQVAGIVAPLKNDSDTDGDSLAISGWSERRDDPNDPSHGDVVCVPPVPGLPWRCLYSADPGFTGTDWFTYTITDGHNAPPPADNGYATARVDVTVTPNRAPKAFPDARVAHGASILPLHLLGNDSDPDDDQVGVISVTPTTDPAGGTVECSSDCTYRPPAVFAGPSVQHFSYTIGDGRGGRSTSTFDVRLIDNVGPTALDDRASARFGDAVPIDVLANDSDPEGDRLTVRLITEPTIDGVPVPHATHGIASCGILSCDYDAPPGFFGDDQFAYEITDESGATDWAVVTVTVVQNRRPVTVDDNVTVAVGTHPSFDPTQNDSDPDGDHVHLIGAGQPDRGKVLCEDDCVYVPDSGAADDVPFSTSFTYTISDDHGGTRTGTVTVHVIANGPPTAENDSMSVMEHVTAWADVVVNDSDDEGDVLTIVSNGDPDHGTVDCTKAPGGVSATPRHFCAYTLAAAYTGPWPLQDAFTYTISDKLGRTSSATVDVTIDTNHAPDMADDEIETRDGVPVTAPVLGNDSDPDGDPLVITAYTSPNFGCGQGGCVYTPPALTAAELPYEETFTYTVSDGHGHTGTASVHVVVLANTGPTAVEDFVTVKSGREALFSVLANDTDPDHDVLSIISASDATNGTVACPSATYGKAPSCTYVSNDGWVGPDEFTYTIDDGHDHPVSGIVHITVTDGTNHPADAMDDDIEIYDSSPTTLDVLENDEDLDGDPLRIVGYEPAPGQPTSKNGHVYCSTTAGGTCRYTPPAGYDGPFPLEDTFTYDATDGLTVDGSGQLVHDTATVTVRLVNRDPDARGDTAKAHGPVAEPIDVLGNDSDPDGDVIDAFELDDGGTAGSVDCANVLSTGFCRYTPAAGFTGTDTFRYTITDHRHATGTATVTVVVTLDEPPVANTDRVNLHGSRQPRPVNVRSNDTDPDGDYLSVIPGTYASTAGGLVECDLEGCVYTPPAGPTDHDTFPYGIDDGHGETATGLVRIGVDVIETLAFVDSKPNPSAYGQDVTFTATVLVPGGGSPTGSVASKEGSTVLGTATVANGGATLTIDDLTPGGHSITATFTGTGAYLGSDAVSPAILQVVGAATTTTSLVADVDPSAVGGLVTFTATVTSSAADLEPTGDVTFLEGDTVLGTGTLSAGQATFATGELEAGLHDITARYEGDTGHEGSTSDPITQHVGTPTANPDATTIDEDADATIIDVLANDTDPDGKQDLVITDPGSPTLGTVEVTPEGTLSYTPFADTSGTDTFTYEISDGLQTSSATVTVTINPVADTPIAEDQSVTPDVLHGTTRTITLTATDVDSAALTFAIGDAPSQGDLGTLGTPVCTPVGAGVSCTVTVDYTARDAGSGADSFTFTASDGTLTSPAGTVSLTVLGAIDVDAGSDTGGAEGAAIDLDGSVTPSDGATTAWSATPGLDVDAGATCTFDDPAALSTAVTCTDDGTWTVTLTADDPGPDPAVADQLTLTVTNADPTVIITDPDDGDAVPATSTVNVSATVADDGTNDTLTCSIDWGDGNVTTGSITAGVCTGSHAYSLPGSVTIKVTVADDDGGSGSDSIGILVDVNDAPSFSKGADQTADEDAGPQSVSGWATAISPGPANESGQTVTFEIVSNSNAALFATAPAISSTGTLTYRSAANANGSATIVIRLHDDGGTANGGHDTSADQSFTITVTAVNDAPSFTKGANPTVLEDAAAQTITNWAMGISRGPSDEVGQTVSFEITSNDFPTLFASGPSVNSAGTLTFQPAANANGIATIKVRARDNGGVAHNGTDASAEGTFTITVTAVNDPPSFTKGANQTVAEDAGAQSVTGWATAIAKGPSNESGQGLSFEVVTNSNPGLFSAGPAVSAAGTLSYTPAANRSGAATITIRLRDNGGVLNNGNDVSPNQSFTITVTPVNDPPTVNAGADFAINEGASANLRGTATDPDGNVTSYRWTQGTRTFNGANASIPFGDNGVYNVTLTACDNATPAACASDVVAVTVRNVAPTLKAKVDKTTVERIDTSRPYSSANFAQVTLEVAGSDVPADTLTYHWNFGDGTGWHTLPARYTRGFQLGQFDGQVTVSDDDGGTSAPLNLHRITVMATGDCNGQSSEVVAARLYDWWGAGTQVTVYNDTVMWFLRGNDAGQVKPKYVFRPGQVTTTRGAGVGSQGPMLQSGCPGKTRFIGIASPGSQYTDTYLPESKLVKLP